MKRNLFQLFFQVPDGTPAGGGPAAPLAPTTTTPPANPASSAPSGQPGAGGAPAAAVGGQPGAAGDPDRSQWIPPYRWNEMTGRYENLQRMHDQTQRQLRALVGVGEPANPEHTRIQQAMFEVFPWLKNLHQNPQMLERVLQMGSNGTLDELVSSNGQGWQRHAADMSRHGVAQLAKAMGKEAKDLGPNGLKRIARELNAFIADDQTGERQQRYEMGDFTLVDEMLTDLTGFYVQPAQVTTAIGAAGQVQRTRALPSAGPRTAPPPPQAGQQPGQPRFASKRERFAAMRTDLLNRTATTP